MSNTYFFLTVMTIMKTVIGAGALSLPYAVSKLGYIFAIAIFVAVTALSYFSTTLLVIAKNLSKHSNFSTIFYYLHMKKPIKILASMFIFLKNVGLCTAQLTIFGQSIRKILIDFMVDKETLEEWYTDKIFIIFLIAICEFPLAAARKIQRLKLFSFFGVFGMSFFVVCLLIHFVTYMNLHGWTPSPTMRPYPQDWFTFSAVIPNILLSLTFQANFFSIYKGMKNSNDHRITSATLTALVSCGSIYLVVCMCAYALYGSELNPNFLLSIEKQNTSKILYYGMNLGFLVSVIFSFPIMFFSARNNFIAMVRLMIAYYQHKPVQKETVSQGEDSEDEQIDNEKKKRRRNAILLYYGLTFLLYGVIITLAILIGNIEIIFNIIGAVCSTTICFLFPYYFFYVITQKHKKKKGIVYYYSKIAFFVLIPYAIFSVIARSL